MLSTWAELFQLGAELIYTKREALNLVKLGDYSHQCMRRGPGKNFVGREIGC